MITWFIKTAANEGNDLLLPEQNESWVDRKASHKYTFNERLIYKLL